MFFTVGGGDLWSLDRPVGVGVGLCRCGTLCVWTWGSLGIWIGRGGGSFVVVGLCMGLWGLVGFRIGSWGGTGSLSWDSVCGGVGPCGVLCQ